MGKGLPLAAWDRVCMPKHKGRLGLRKMDTSNKAFQCKLAWQILTNEDSIWTRLMRDKYIEIKEFLRVITRPTGSPVWKSVMNSRQLLKKELFEK